MIEEDFYCTLKLKSGEEIFAKVAATEEEDRTLLLVSNPIIVNEIKSKIGVVGYKIEPWFVVVCAIRLELSEESITILRFRVPSSQTTGLQLHPTIAKNDRKGVSCGFELPKL